MTRAKPYTAEDGQRARQFAFRADADANSVGVSEPAVGGF
jgi:hypothetical protein